MKGTRGLSAKPTLAREGNHFKWQASDAIQQIDKGQVHNEDIGGIPVAVQEVPEK